MHVSLFKPSGPDRIALVATLPASGASGASGVALYVQVARGPSREKLRAPTLFGPMTPAVAEEIFTRELAALRAEGYVRGGLADLLVRVESKSRRKRALAAHRLGWLRERAAVEPLLALAARANEELPVVLDALGEIGDPRAIPVARGAAERKLLSRRRAGVEALRKLGDKEGLADARKRALERVPSVVQAVLADVDAGKASPGALVAALEAVPVRERGLAIDSLYELGIEHCTHAARAALLASDLGAPHLWRYAKSVLKRAMLRHDAVTFGQVAHAIEAAARETKGTTETVKSGFDGEAKSLRIFGLRTQRYMKRLSWRYLRMLARYRPEHYPWAAAEALARYTDEDAAAPAGLYGSYADCYLLGRIVYGASPRFVLDSRSLRLRFKTAKDTKLAADANAREEAFPELWDRTPLAYVRVLSGRLVVLHAWALRALESRHPRAIEEAPHSWVVALVGAPYPPTVALGLGELRRRFDPSNPDFTLVLAVLHDARAEVRDLGLEWLALTVNAWAFDPAQVVAFLSGGDGTARLAVATHVVAALAAGAPAASSAARTSLARAILDVLRLPEKTEGDHDPFAAIAAALSSELAALLPPAELVALLTAASAAARAMAASVLSVHPEAARLIGPAELAVLGAHPQVSLREAARGLLLQRLSALRADPSPLFNLLDGAWPDMRAFAAGLLKSEIDVAHFSVDALIGLADSTHVDGQDLAKVLIGRRLAELPAQELLQKLLEHPHRNMRRYVLDLVRAHLKPGFVPLASTEEFFRTVFLDLSPDRSLKRDAIAFLRARGLSDARQAEIAVRLLSEVLRSKTRFDFDLALEALTQITFAFLSGESPLPSVVSLGVGDER
jgi:hypothetical protein